MILQRQAHRTSSCIHLSPHVQLMWNTDEIPSNYRHYWVMMLASVQMDSLIRPLENIITWSEKRKLSNGAERHRWKGRSLGFCFSLFREHSIARVTPVICVQDNLTLVAKKKWQWYLYWKLLWKACAWASRGMWCRLELITLDHINNLILFYCLWRTFTVWNYLDHLPVYNFTVSHSLWPVPLTSGKECQQLELLLCFNAVPPAPGWMPDSEWILVWAFVEVGNKWVKKWGKECYA